MVEQLPPAKPLILFDSMLEESEKKDILGVDDKVDPFSERWTLNNDPGAGTGVPTSQKIDGLTPAQDIISENELYQASFTPKGAYITRISIRFAFYQGWKIIASRQSQKPADNELQEKIVKLNKQYNLKSIVTQMARVSSIFGRALVYKQENPAAKRPKNRVFLRVSPVRDVEIEWDNKTGYPKMYHLLVRWGIGIKKLEIDPKDAILVIWDLDECGNLHEGIPALTSAYNTILRSEVVSDEFSTNIADRGLGFIDILDKKAKTLDDLKNIRKSFKLGKDRIFVHGGNYEAKVTQGISQGFNFDESQTRYTKDTSSATGYPGMAMEGVQTGAVTGSETDQDNRAMMYRLIQEMMEPYILDLYAMLDKSLINEDFELDWAFEIKQSRAVRATTMATFGAAINQIQDLIKVNQCMSLLELPLMGEMEGNFLLSEWIAINSPVINTMPENPNATNNDVRVRDYPPVDIKDAATKKEQMLKTGTEKDKIIFSLKPGAGESENPELYKTDSMNDEDLKRAIAKRLKTTGDSYNKINYMLLKMFGSGLSNTTIQNL